MTYQLRLPLLAVVLFCLTSMAGCPNKEPGGQITVVQGTVTNLRTGRPMPGVRLALASSDRSPRSYYTIEDTTLTDAQGKYALSFTNVKGLYYGINCEAPDDNDQPFKLDLPDSTDQYSSVYNLRTASLVLGRTNNVSFRPSPRRVFRVQVATLVTKYQQLRFDWQHVFAADNQTRTVWLYQSVPFYKGVPQNFYNRPGTVPRATFSRTLANGIVQDTTVLTQASTPLTGDTVRVSLRFGR